MSPSSGDQPMAEKTKNMKNKKIVIRLLPIFLTIGLFLSFSEVNACDNDNECGTGDVCTFYEGEITGICVKDTSVQKGTQSSQDSATVSPNTGTPSPSTTSGATTITRTSIIPPEVYNSGLSNSTVRGILVNLLNWLLGILGILAIIAFIISGIQYLLSYASEDLAEKAKKNMTYAIIGIVVALSSFVILQAIELALQGSYSWF